MIPLGTEEVGTESANYQDDVEHGPSVDGKMVCP